MASPAIVPGHRGRYVQNPTEDQQFNTSGRLANQAQRMQTKAELFASAQQQRQALIAAGANPTLLPVIRPDMSPTDLGNAQSHMAKVAGPRLPAPAGSAIDQGGGIVPRPRGAAPSGLAPIPSNPDDRDLLRANMDKLRPAKPVQPPDIHTDLGDNGTVNPRPGMVQNPADGLYYRPGAAKAGATAPADAPLVPRPTGPDPSRDYTPAQRAATLAGIESQYGTQEGGNAPAPVVGSISKGVITDANGNMVAGPGTKSGTPAWHKDVIDKFPQIGVKGSPENQRFVSQYNAAMANPKLAGIFNPMTAAEFASKTPAASPAAAAGVTAQTAKNDVPSTQPTPIVDSTEASGAANPVTKALAPVVQATGVGNADAWFGEYVQPFKDVGNYVKGAVKGLFAPIDTNTPNPATPPGPTATGSEKALAGDPTIPFSQNPEDPQFKKKLENAGTSPSNYGR